MNKTAAINAKAKARINKITAHDIYSMHDKQRINLWKIRDASPLPLTKANIHSFGKLQKENSEDFWEVLERHSWF